jgi:hypothetical protein
MSFKLTIETDNEAFADGPEEIVRLLRQVASRLMYDEVQGKLVDINGNYVGGWDSAAE